MVRDPVRCLFSCKRSQCRWGNGQMRKRIPELYGAKATALLARPKGRRCLGEHLKPWVMSVVTALATTAVK
ncbi:hypothetical protein EVAR_9023_1 [Eumeta japonica]|uniref:Uncharacterized protein n=1 Tax=Eumeta variegata TaxID=151549 RepID=A0A4C1TVX3_EUMVA|nr:hypothetical protein EVAR_9023_1 [Eumeta japonica]